MTVYAKAKRAKKGKSNKKKITTCIILLIILGAIAYLIISNRLWDLKINKPMQEIEENIAQNNTEEETATVVEEKKDEVVDVEIPAKMGGYDVIGQLVIDKIDLTKNILAIADDNALDLSVAHYYGGSLNQSGNFCIIGHNWKNMLKRLPEMQVGDTFYLINAESKTKVTYQIYNMYTCVPEDLSALDEIQNGKREVTLITCNPGGLTRLICKAREI